MASYRILLFLTALFTLSKTNQCIDLPDGIWNLTTIDNAEKNAGVAETDESDSDGDMHLGPPANKKGDHLASAAAYLRATNATLADEIMSTAGVSALKGPPSLLTGGVSALWGEMSSSLSYFGGPILTAKTAKVYVIFYGSWSARNKKPVIDFLKALGSKNPKGKLVPSVSDWWKINSKNYYNSKKKYVASDLTVGQFAAGYSMKPKGSKSRPLSRFDIQSIIRKAFAKKLPFDPNALYFVITSKDVYVDSFCTTTCSYHSFFKYQNKRVAFSFVGDSTNQCRLYCTYEYMDPSASTYNGLGIDGVISMMAHELAGMSTNMFQGKNSPAGWVVANSQIENADLCSWMFGEDIQWDRKGGNIYAYNLVGPNKSKFIVQTNFNLKTGSCEMKYKT